MEALSRCRLRVGSESVAFRPNCEMANHEDTESKHHENEECTESTPGWFEMIRPACGHSANDLVHHSESQHASSVCQTNMGRFIVIG